MRTHQATVYELSRTLTAVATDSGRLILCKNLREPLELNPTEAKNLLTALRGEHDAT